MSGYSAPAFGLLSTGFVPKITSDVLLDITTAARGTVDNNLDLSPSEPMGQIVGIVAGSIAEVWEIAEETYNAINPAAAQGALLYGTGAVTGTVLRGATYSVCIVNAVLGASASINPGLIASVNSQPTNTWSLLGACDSFGNLTSTQLTSTSAGTYKSLWQSTTKGPNAAAAGQLTVIASLPAGLTSISNPADAQLGLAQETDAQFRIRRLLELNSAGSESLDAIRASVLSVTNVISAQVYENVGDTTDGSGRPPHSIEVVVWDGVSPLASNNAIAQALWNEKPGGIQFYSASGDSGTATDSQGGTHTIVFTRVTPVTVYINITTVGAGSATAVKNSILGVTGALIPGNPVIRLQVMCAPLPDGPFPVAGCTDVTAFTLGLAPAPAGTANLTFTSRQYAYVQSANITVTLT